MIKLNVKPLRKVTDLFLGNTRKTRYFYLMASDDEEHIVVADDIQHPIYDEYDIVEVNGKEFEVVDSTDDENYLLWEYNLDNFDGWYKVI